MHLMLCNINAQRWLTSAIHDSADCIGIIGLIQAQIVVLHRSADLPTSEFIKPLFNYRFDLQRSR